MFALSNHGKEHSLQHKGTLVGGPTLPRLWLALPAGLGLVGRVVLLVGGCGIEGLRHARRLWRPRRALRQLPRLVHILQRSSQISIIRCALMGLQPF